MALRYIRDDEVVPLGMKELARAVANSNRATGTEIQQTASRTLEALENAEQAIEDAANALTTSNGKNARRRGETEPSAPPGGWVPGDQWIVNNSDGKPIEVRVWDGDEFVFEQVLAAELLVVSGGGVVRLADGVVTANAIAADAIDGMIITGAIIRTAASGQRLQLDANGLCAYDASGALVSRLYSASGIFEVQAAPITGRTSPRLYLSTTRSSGGVAQTRGDSGKPTAQSFAPYYDLTAQQNPGGSSKLVLGSGSAERGDDHDALVTLRAVGGIEGIRRVELLTGYSDTPLHIGEANSTTVVYGRLVASGELLLSGLRPLPGTMLATDSKIASTSGATAGATLTTIMVGVTPFLSVPVTVDIATEVVISARANLYGSTGGGCQLGTNQTGASPYTTPTDDPSVGKAPAGLDMVVESKRYATLLPGTTNVLLAWRGAAGNSIRNPTISIQAL